MIQSMTGFGSAEGNGFRVEIRSLNHRHLEISLKLPPLLLKHDMTLRQLIKKKFLRGKFDINIIFTSDEKYRVKINPHLARSVYGIFENLKTELSLRDTVSLAHLLTLKEILLSEDIDFNPEELFSTVEEAICRVYEMRVKEAEEIINDIMIILNTLKVSRDQIESQFKNSIKEHRDNLIKKINELITTPPVDENRLSQEIAFIAQRSDINEELIRLKSHLEKIEKIFLKKDEEELVGRKLDFLSQEILRELNTIASKTDLIDIVYLVIKMKLEVEKLREHAQNLQ